MKKIIEISVFGDIYYFVDNLNDKQLDWITSFTHDYFSKSKINKEINISDYLNSLKEKHGISLEQVYVSNVISV